MASLSRTRPRRAETILRPVHPNAGLEAEYRRRLTALIDEMGRSLTYWLSAAYRGNSPEIAEDELPAETMRRAMRRLARRWQANFNDLADDLASHFAQSVGERSDASLKAALKKGGFTVEFKMTRAQRDVLNAAVHENVSLIRSIPQQHLAQVEGMVMRSVSTGRDLGQLADDLQQQLGVTKKRAALIARDQNNKVTAALARARQVEMGLTEAVWRHSGGGKHPRPKHVKADGQRYDIRVGLPIGDKGQNVLPGQEINCRCIGRAVVPGFA